MEKIKRRRLSAKERNHIFKMFDGKCAYCGCSLHNMSAMQVDHKKPLHIGGADTLDNMYPSCRSCNNYKRTLDIEKFREYLAGLPKRLKRDDVAFTKDMIVGILTFNIPRIQLDWCLICETIKGNYEIVEKEK